MDLSNTLRDMVASTDSVLAQMNEGSNMAGQQILSQPESSNDNLMNEIGLAIKRR